MRIFYLYTLLFLTYFSLVSIPTVNLSLHQDTTTPQPNLFCANQYKHSHQQQTTRNNLLTYSASDLKLYFDYHRYSEKDILACNVLYMSNEFVHYAKTLPGYRHAVKKLYHSFNRMCRIRKFFKTMDGSYYPNLFKRIRHLYKEIKRAEKTINTYAHQFVHEYNINLTELFPHNGSMLARDIYENYVTILNEAALLPYQNIIARDYIGQASSIGLEANKHGHTKQASQLAHFCWTILDLSKAFGEGIYLGTVNALHTLTHPVQTIKNSLIGIGIIAYELGELTATTGECLFLYSIDSDQYFIRQQEIVTCIDKIIEDASKKLRSMPIREIVKHSTAFVTETVFCTKICSFAHKTANQLLPLAKNYFELITKQEPVIHLSNASTIEFSIPKNISKSIKNTISKMEAVHNMPPTYQAFPQVTHNTQEIINAIAKIEPNRIHHILAPTTEKHAWSKVCKNPLDWNEVKNIIEKVMLEGEITKIKNGIITQILHFKNEIIEVKYRYINNTLLSIINAWVQTR